MDLLVLPIMVSAVGIGLVSLCAMIGMALLSFQRAEFAKNLMNNTIYPLLFGVAACWIGYAVVLAVPDQQLIQHAKLSAILFWGSIPLGIGSGLWWVHRFWAS